MWKTIFKFIHHAVAIVAAGVVGAIGAAVAASLAKGVSPPWDLVVGFSLLIVGGGIGVGLVYVVFFAMWRGPGKPESAWQSRPSGILYYLFAIACAAAAGTFGAKTGWLACAKMPGPNAPVRTIVGRSVGAFVGGAVGVMFVWYLFFGLWKEDEETTEDGAVEDEAAGEGVRGVETQGMTE